ncbi:hypothetical protein BDQ17DRAFT_1341559 [Cyathus striatus]|nr:hypothetical protein BDQ17DRAFT_1341559 [Cyathus striatus]
MTTETTKAAVRLNNLTNSLDELESYLDPLFAQTLPETLVGLEPIQQAKAQTVIPYLIYDLIFIYLKLRGIDPKHILLSLNWYDRVRHYFEKISTAENPPTRRTEIDKAVASRFIKNAITQVKWKKTAAEEEEDEDQETSTSEKIPAKVTSKMLERAQYEKELRERDAEGDEEDSLMVFDESKERDDTHVEESINTQKGEGPLSNKRRRPLVDPFAGYGDDTVEDNAAALKKSKQTLLETSQVSASSKTNTMRKNSMNEPDANVGQSSKKRKTKSKKSAKTS